MTSYMVLNKFASKYKNLVDMFILNELVKGDPEYVYQASLHIIRAGGKRLRPMITLSTARMLGGHIAESRALPIAAGVEVFHTFTLIHDDIMDEDDYRRGVPTVHKLWGVPAAILAGDLLHSLSYKAILLSKQRGLKDEYLVKALNVMVEAAVKVSEGQGYDMRYEKELVTYHDYLRMIYLKTGALIEASAKLGAIAAESPDPLVESMASYGALVGLAFQIRDDVLGVFGDPSKTGKPVYNDLRRGKKTVLVLYAYDKSSGKDREVLEKVLSGTASEDEIVRAAKIIEETGAREYAMELARSYAKSAIEILEDLSESGLVQDEEALKALVELAEFSVEREK